MRISKWLIALVVIFTCSFTVHAEMVVVGLNDDVHFDFPGLIANDFHVEGLIHSAGGIAPVVNNVIVFGDGTTGNWTVAGYTLTQIGPEDWWFTIDFVTDGSITYCQWLHFGIEFYVEMLNVIADLHGWWTLNGVPINGPMRADQSDVAVTGFWADDLGTIRPGLQTLRITNDTTNIPIVIPQYEVAISYTRVPLEDMFTNGLGRPGEPSPMYPDLEWITIDAIPPLPPESFFDVYLEDYGVIIPPGGFLLMRGQQLWDGAPTRGGGDWGWFWEQHGAPAASGTIGATYTIDPPSGAVPFTTLHQASLFNLYNGSTRRFAARVNVVIGNGNSYNNWKIGWTNVQVGNIFVTQWNTIIPALGSMLGNNVFTLQAEDVTPAPFNQAPHPPSGDTAVSVAIVDAHQ